MSKALTNMKMGYVLIVLGIALVIAGAVIISKEKKTETATPSTNNQPQKAPAKKDDPFTENEKKGRAFEEYVVKHFNKDYFTIKEWRGDKGVDGRYAEENKKPDIVMTLHLRSGNSDVAVECKWRSDFINGEVRVTYPEQLDRYRDYARTSGMPVFMVVGIGGEPSQPKAVYVVPLNKIKGAKLTEKELEPFFHKADSNFYYDAARKTLR